MKKILQKKRTTLRRNLLKLKMNISIWIIIYVPKIIEVAVFGMKYVVIPVSLIFKSNDFIFRILVVVFFIIEAIYTKKRKEE